MKKGPSEHVVPEGMSQQQQQQKGLQGSLENDHWKGKWWGLALKRKVLRESPASVLRSSNKINLSDAWAAY